MSNAQSPIANPGSFWTFYWPLNRPGKESKKFFHHEHFSAPTTPSKARVVKSAPERRANTNAKSPKGGVMQNEVKDPKETATIVVELSVEDLEEVIAPRIAINHNETLVDDEVELSVEEMDEVIAPKIAINHNETIVRDIAPVK
jgi:hypothetical protein